MQKGYDAYRQNNTMVESPEKLIEMLYEGILKFSSLAKKSIENKNIEKRSYYINRTTAIYVELIASLDMKGGDIAQYLYGLYNHQLTLLTEANIENSAIKLGEVINVASVLLESWKEETSRECAMA
jgi:flagellar protein FliS